MSPAEKRLLQLYCLLNAGGFAAATANHIGLYLVDMSRYDAAPPGLFYFSLLMTAPADRLRNTSAASPKSAPPPSWLMRLTRAAPLFYTLVLGGVYLLGGNVAQEATLVSAASVWTSPGFAATAFAAWIYAGLFLAGLERIAHPPPTRAA